MNTKGCMIYGAGLSGAAAVKEIRDDYKMFIEHHSIGLGETVLYAV